jgi:hypothetical protein
MVPTSMRLGHQCGWTRNRCVLRRITREAALPLAYSEHPCASPFGPLARSNYKYHPWCLSLRGLLKLFKFIPDEFLLQANLFQRPRRLRPTREPVMSFYDCVSMIKKHHHPVIWQSIAETHAVFDGSRERNPASSRSSSMNAVSARRASSCRNAAPR